MWSSDTPKKLSLEEVLQCIALLPQMLEVLKEQQREITRLKAELQSTGSKRDGNADGWLDAKSAASYMGISCATFDKYRYKTTPAIKGYALDGKVLYKKHDLDLFMKLYALKAKGVA